MIRIDKGTIEVEGSTQELLAEAALAMRYLYQKSILTMEDYKFIGEVLSLSTEELEKKTREAREKLVKEHMPELIMRTLSGDKAAAFILNQHYNGNKATEKEGKIDV